MICIALTMFFMTDCVKGSEPTIVCEKIRRYNQCLLYHNIPGIHGQFQRESDLPNITPSLLTEEKQRHAIKLSMKLTVCNCRSSFKREGCRARISASLESVHTNEEIAVELYLFIQISL